VRTRGEGHLSDDGWDDYLYWQTQDRKILKRVNQLIEDISRHENTGIGKPEPLRHEWAGWWSAGSLRSTALSTGWAATGWRSLFAGFIMASRRRRPTAGAGSVLTEAG
jgi:YoeB-like toxin of type II toxin-antitoxin system